MKTVLLRTLSNRLSFSTPFFVKQCLLINNNCKIPSSLPHKTDKSLSNSAFSDKDIGKINPNKAHGHDMISIHILQICGASIYRSFEIIFKSYSETGCFPSQWK